MTRHHPAPIPTGYELVLMGGSFITSNGPFYVRKHEDGRVNLGMRIERRHCNAMGTCHGGMLATFADMMMPVILYDHPQLAATGCFLPTASMQLDFLGMVRMGDWIEGECEVLKVTRTLAFAQGMVRVDGKPVLRASGVYAVGPKMPPGSPGMYVAESPFESPPRRA